MAQNVLKGSQKVDVPVFTWRKYFSLKPNCHLCTFWLLNEEKLWPKTLKIVQSGHTESYRWNCKQFKIPILLGHFFDRWQKKLTKNGADGLTTSNSQILQSSYFKLIGNFNWSNSCLILMSRPRHATSRSHLPKLKITIVQSPPLGTYYYFYY